MQISDIEVNFSPKDLILVKVFSTKGSVRFTKRDMMSPIYIRLFEVLERVGEVAYKLAILRSISAMSHAVFYMSMLKKHVSDGTHKLSY